MGIYFLGIYSKLEIISIFILVVDIVFVAANILNILYCITELKESIGECFKITLIESLEKSKIQLLKGIIIFILWLLIPNKETIQLFL